MKNYCKLVLLSSFYFSNSYAASFIKDDDTKKDTIKKQADLIVKADVLLAPLGSVSEALNHNGGGSGYYYSFTIEKLLKKRHSVQLTCTNNWYDHSVQYHQNKYDKWALLPEYKFFVSNKKHGSGYYVGAYGKYLNYNYDNVTVTSSDMYTNAIKYKEIMLGGGISNGVQFYACKRLTIDILIGAGILKPLDYSHTQYYDGTSNTFYKNYKIKFDARATVNIGYRF